MGDFSQYRAIHSKLKRRFPLRKPNYSQASKQFTDLSQDFKDFELFAGYCCLASARCEHSLGNSNMELQALLQAARYFAKGEEINAAISAYRHAILVANPSISSIVYTELARFFESNKRFNEAGVTYEEAGLLKEAANAYMDAHFYDKALFCYRKLEKSQLNLDDEVSIFLLKLHHYDNRRFSINFPIIQNDSENDDIISLNTLLESLYCCESEGHDNEEVKTEIMNRLSVYLNGRQKELLYYHSDVSRTR
ncbi:40-kDa huntingtin-associated protein-like isoform X2 [Brevipalpus obovatus]|uniref:40-kDa huntingtin-associated protein-like isoform X2 n=1 Tax=Brevipalpus obovatus TaxID=246614 RepID=UPI003D9E1F6F